MTKCYALLSVLVYQGHDRCIGGKRTSTTPGNHDRRLHRQSKHLDSNGLRTLYTQLWNLEGGAPFQMLDIVLHLLMTRDGVEATEAFVDTLD